MFYKCQDMVRYSFSLAPPVPCCILIWVHFSFPHILLGGGGGGGGWQEKLLENVQSN